ncbi:MAG: hypothetical protein NTW87_11915 [Planctomycetota bacterium]|nr:hypothetical protein [Planctomycetota bacterium]
MMAIPMHRVPWLRRPDRMNIRHGWRPRKPSAADRARAKAERKRLVMLMRVAMAKGRFENSLVHKPAPELLELALSRVGELDVLLKQLVRLARGSWQRPRAGRSHRPRPPVVVIVPSKRRRHARAG